jgi:Type II secretion system (T2SS), protein E, N-terminal domain
MAKIKTKEDLQRLARQLHMQAFQPLATFEVPDEAISELIPADVAWSWNMAIIGVAVRTVTVAIDDPDNEHKDQIINRIRDRGYQTTFYLTTSSDLENLLKIVHPAEQVEFEQ